MTDPYRHYERNRDEYRRIADALRVVNDTFESAELPEQLAMLTDSMAFSVISVQNSVEVLRRAFRAYAQSTDMDEVREALRRVNYGNNKFEYIKYNVDVIDGVVGPLIVSDMEECTWDAVESISAELKGVSWIKGAFTPAMLGYTDVMCIDTNVAQQVDGVNAKGYSDLKAYRGAVDMVKSEFPQLASEVSTFMLQWIVFDANRGNGVEKHPEWFEHILPGSPFGTQQTLEMY